MSVPPPPPLPPWKMTSSPATTMATAMKMTTPTGGGWVGKNKLRPEKAAPRARRPILPRRASPPSHHPKAATIKKEKVL